MKKIRVLLMLVLLCFSVVSVVHAQPNGPIVGNSIKDRLLRAEGTVRELKEKGFLLQAEDSNQNIYMHLGSLEYVVNGKSGKQLTRCALQEGQKVTVYHSPVMTRSIPPQTQAFAVLIGQGDDVAHLMKIAKIEKSCGDLRVWSANQDVIVTVVSAEQKNISAAPGDVVLAWYEVVALSMPGQATATKFKNLSQ